MKYLKSTLFLYLLTSDSIAVSALRPSHGCNRVPTVFDLGYDIGPGESLDFIREIPGTQAMTHRLTLPTNYDPSLSPSPFLIYFHGHGGNHEDCGEFCDVTAAGKGFVSAAMTGYGPDGFNSWNFAGSSSSPGPKGSTCEASAPDICQFYSEIDPTNPTGQSSGCDCSGADNCWWTTCYDSVEQVLDVLDKIGNDICIDLDQVWAVGQSNGGMFTYELASDKRSAPKIAGIVPIVGLPHYGFSVGPDIDMPMFGIFGTEDIVVPPISNTDNPDKTLDTFNGIYYGGGWYYTSLPKVMSDWTMSMGCTGVGQDSMGQEDFGIPDNLYCTQGCSEREDGIRVVGCLYEGDHSGPDAKLLESSFNFMLTPRKKAKSSKAKGHKAKSSKTSKKSPKTGKEIKSSK